MSGYMGFVGVSTAGSAIMRIFPRWAQLLDLPTGSLVGHDLPVDASAADYLAIVERIRDDPLHLGALVTTHKMGVYAAAHHLFAQLDGFSRLCGEVSSISKRNGALIGHAKDPLTVGLALDEFLPASHFGDSGGWAVCLGAGGAGTALAWHLAERRDSPQQIVVTDTSRERLDQLRAVLAAGTRSSDRIDYRLVTTADVTGQLLNAAPSGSLIVNASGLGKDRPGSPLPSDAAFPRKAVVWEFNYRGTLEYLATARAQQKQRELTVVDGWRYFIHGWTQVIAEVFDRPLGRADLDRLAAAAESAR